MSRKAVAYGINLIAVVHHYYQSPTAERRNAVATKTNGGDDLSRKKGEAAKKNKPFTVEKRK